jgi:hypothetical protein
MPKYTEMDAQFILQAFLSDEKLLRHIKKKVHVLKKQANITHPEDYKFIVNNAIDISLAEIGIHDLVKAYFEGKKRPPASGGGTSRRSQLAQGGANDSPSLSAGSRKSQVSSTSGGASGVPSPGASSHVSKLSQSSRGSSHNQISLKKSPGSPDRKVKGKGRKSNGERKSSPSPGEKQNGNTGNFDFNQTYRFTPDDFRGLASPMHPGNGGVPNGGGGNNDHSRRDHGNHGLDDYDDIGGPRSFASGTTATVVTSAAIAAASSNSSPPSSRRYSADNTRISDDFNHNTLEQDSDEAFYRNEFDEIIASPDPFGTDSATIPVASVPLHKQALVKSHDLTLKEATEPYNHSLPPVSNDKTVEDWKVVGEELTDEVMEQKEDHTGSDIEIIKREENGTADRSKENKREPSFEQKDNQQSIEPEHQQEREDESDEDQNQQFDEDSINNSDPGLQHEEDVAEENVEEEEDPDGDYSMGDFESPTNSPHRESVRSQVDHGEEVVDQVGESPARVGGQRQRDGRVYFPDDVVASTLYHRMKYLPAETAELFYTQDEAMQFQYDYDREVNRADNANLDWYEWIMTRTEEQEAADEEEDAAMQQQAYEEYWEGQDDEVSDNSNEFW